MDEQPRLGKTVLLVIDVQEGAFDGRQLAPVVGADRMLSNISSLSQKFTPQGQVEDGRIRVIYVQDNGKVGGAFDHATAGWRLHASIAPERTADEPVDFIDRFYAILHKQTPNAFDNLNLQRLIFESDKESKPRFVICGLHSSYCVATSAITALQTGCSVILVSDAHGSIDSATETAPQIVDRVNADLMQQGATVMTTEKVLEEKWP
eukprot:Clim_evm3s78 gene=Clim_evmTU3s78